MSLLIWNDFDLLVPERGLSSEQLLLVWVGSSAPPQHLPEVVRQCTCAVISSSSRHAGCLYTLLAHAFLQMQAPLPRDGAFFLMGSGGHIWGVLPALPEEHHAISIWQQLFKAAEARWRSKEPIAAMEDITNNNTLMVPDSCDRLLFDADPVWGGWDVAPKYISPARIRALSLSAVLYNNRAFRMLADRTLASIWDGGCFDPIGGGVFAGSSDNRWTAPLPYQQLEDQLAIVDALLVSPSVLECSLTRYMLIRIVKAVIKCFGLRHASVAVELRWLTPFGKELAYSKSYLEQLKNAVGISDASLSALGLHPDNTDGVARAHMLRQHLSNRNYGVQQEVHKLCELLYCHRQDLHPAVVLSGSHWHHIAAVSRLMSVGELLGHVGWIRMAAEQIGVLSKRYSGTSGLLESCALLWQQFLREGKHGQLLQLQHLMQRWLDTGECQALPLAAAIDIVALLAYLQRFQRHREMALSDLVLRLMPSANHAQIMLLAQLAKQRIAKSPTLKCSQNDWRYLRDLIRPGRLPALALLPVPSERPGIPVLEIPNHFGGTVLIEGRREIAEYVLNSSLARALAIFS